MPQTTVINLLSQQGKAILVMKFFLFIIKADYEVLSSDSSSHLLVLLSSLLLFLYICLQS